MNIKYNIIIALILSVSINGFSQENKIVSLLNNQLQKELRKYKEDYFDSLKIVQAFHIDSNKKLGLEVEKYDPHLDRWQTIKSEMPLNKISGLIKDVNVLLISDGETVLVTVKTFNGKRELIRTDIKDTNLFFTEINKERKNKKFRNQVLAAFKKAGFKIKSDTWMD